MPLYINPDFRRLPSGIASAFGGEAESFFQLPVWYDLVARHGVPPGARTRVYTDERARSATAVVLQTPASGHARRLESLTNAHSLEHGLIYRSASDLQNALAAIVSEILKERPRWDWLTLSELDPSDPSYAALAGALRREGFLVECSSSSGTWYEETTDLSFTDYLAARPSELRNTWRRKRRKLEEIKGLAKRFFLAGDNDI